jgi:hypothetical protein
MPVEPPRRRQSTLAHTGRALHARTNKRLELRRGAMPCARSMRGYLFDALSLTPRRSP